MAETTNSDQVQHVVLRFLAWKLPDNFNPDGGITFKREFNENTAHPMKHEPRGTNLFDAGQATAMVEYILAGMPAPTKPEPNPEWEAKAAASHAEIRAESGPIEPEVTLRMLRTWLSHAEPANEHGQISFSRAMMESAIDALAGFLEPTQAKGLIAMTITPEALERLRDFALMVGLSPPYACTVSGRKIYGSDLAEALATLEATQAENVRLREAVTEAERFIASVRGGLTWNSSVYQSFNHIEDLFKTRRALSASTSGEGS